MHELTEGRGGDLDLRPDDQPRPGAERRDLAAAEAGERVGDRLGASDLPLTHASFFSGVGGLDLGLARAGWRTVSFSEIDPYANAVLAERWPGVPNLGDIVALDAAVEQGDPAGGRDRADPLLGGERDGRRSTGADHPPADPDPLRRDPGGERGADPQPGRGGTDPAARPRPRRRPTGGSDVQPVGGLAALGDDEHGRDRRQGGSDGRQRRVLRNRHESGSAGGLDWRTATLWSGGFPCQDLSVAGKRHGFAGARSSLAFAFLDLVERYRPPAILFENVPGLLSSNGGRDMARLLAEMVDLGYGVAWRVLDARFFGVPQRRRRVFLVGIRAGGRAGAERAAEVLSVGSRCDRHPATGHPKGAGAAPGPAIGSELAGSLTRRYGKGINSTLDDGAAVLANAIPASAGHHGHSSPRGDGGDNLVSQAPDSGGVRAADGLAGRVDDLDDLAPTLLAPVVKEGGRRDRLPMTISPTLRVGPANIADGGPGDTVPIVYTKSRRAQNDTDDETWVGDAVMPTLNAFDVGDTRTTAAILSDGPAEDPLLPLGLDSHRYRCCGNGVVSSVAEWIGIRLAEVLR